MMNPHQTALISLLLGSFPNFQSGDSEAALLAYQFVIKDADERDLEAGVSTLINGEYSGHDGRFAPTAPQLASVVRMARDRRQEREHRNARRLAPPPEPTISPEERERVGAKMREFAEARVADRDALHAEVERKRKEIFAKVNARFQPDMSDEAVAKRLGFTAGDPVGDADAA